MLAMQPVIIFVAFILHISFAQLTNDKTKLMNWCLNSTLHKNVPVKEDLHGQCHPWSEKACCTSETTKNIHEGDMHNFNLNHCFEETGQNMSSVCRKYFNLDNCFYECEPHIGLWVVQTKRKIATERFQNVPLCASECVSWFESCKNDFTCAYNWPRNFQFKNGVNSCRKDNKCMTFEKIYQNSTAFCENVWDHSWKVVPDEKPCMSMSFKDPKNNPNAKVAEYYIEQIAGGASSVVENLPFLAINLLITLVFL